MLNESQNKTPESVVIYTDGGCDPNPGTGGWAAILLHGGHTKEIKGGESDTTNNRMELIAALRALEALKRPCKVKLFTDSQYLQKGITEWLPDWKRRNWMRKSGTLKNEELWRRLDAVTVRHQIEWHWVRGHADDAYNNRCDELAAEAIREQKAKQHHD